VPSCENHFHAIFEATKGIAERIRLLSGLSGDGADLVNKAFTGQQPVLALTLCRAVSAKVQVGGRVSPDSNRVAPTWFLAHRSRTGPGTGANAQALVTHGFVSYDINSLSWNTSGNGTDPVDLPVEGVPVPLPATSWLLLAGFVGLVANRRKLGDPVAALPTVVDLHA
jgi:hypothetical protein